MTQYQRELEAILKEGLDVDKFKKDWHKRACASYRSNVKTKDDVNRFRIGDFNI